MVGFNNVLVLDKKGKVKDYQKSYNNEYSKILNVFLPLQFNNKDFNKIELHMALENTFPKEIVIVEGVKDNYDLNKYIFDLSEMYRNYYYSSDRKRTGLCRVILYSDNDCVKFESESFRV